MFVALCIVLMPACASLPSRELSQLGSELTAERIDFAALLPYALRSKTAYGSNEAITKAFPKTVRIASPSNDSVLYFLEVDDVRRQQFVTVRGTANKKNLDEDFDFVIREDRQTDIPVHAGFDADSRAIHSDVLPYLKKDYQTFITGHSLGGAIAAILGIYLIEDQYNVVRIVTFGQPRFTTDKAVSRLGFLPLTRVVDENDIIPMVPPATVLDPAFGPYAHVGPEIILLEGPHYVYLPTHDATRIDIGEFWREAAIASLKDHKIDHYLERIEAKSVSSIQVPYNDREKYVAKKPVAVPPKV
jgi:triacylglycerol lipase